MRLTRNTDPIFVIGEEGAHFDEEETDQHPSQPPRSPSPPRRRGLGHLPITRPSAAAGSQAATGLIAGPAGTRARRWARRALLGAAGASLVAAIVLLGSPVGESTEPTATVADSPSTALSPATPPTAPMRQAPPATKHPRPRPPHRRPDVAEGSRHDRQNPPAADPTAQPVAAISPTAAPRPPAHERFGFED